MISVFEHHTNSGHTLEEDAIIEEGDECYTCRKLVTGSPTYTFTSYNNIRSIFIHKNCSELPISTDFHKHALILKKDVIIGEDAACHICNTPITGFPTCTCVSRDVTISCQSFYLHKSCAELERQINHHKHSLHPLSLLLRPDDCICDLCSCDVKICYACAHCDVDVCVSCASEQRVIHHEGHKEHALTSMKKEAHFECDACDEEAKDSSYVCTTCEFWIHKSCAISPSVIPAPTYHLHPLTLIYSIPDIHRLFKRLCGICDEQVSISSWMYYCHKCTYFVHMKCSTSTASMTDNKKGLHILLLRLCRAL